MEQRASADVASKNRRFTKSGSEAAATAAAAAVAAAARAPAPPYTVQALQRQAAVRLEMGGSGGGRGQKGTKGGQEQREGAVSSVVLPALLAVACLPISEPESGLVPSPMNADGRLTGGDASIFVAPASSIWGQQQPRRGGKKQKKAEAALRDWVFRQLFRHGSGRPRQRIRKIADEGDGDSGGGSGSGDDDGGGGGGGGSSVSDDDGGSFDDGGDAGMGAAMPPLSAPSWGAAAANCIPTPYPPAIAPGGVLPLPALPFFAADLALGTAQGAMPVKGGKKKANGGRPQLAVAAAAPGPEAQPQQPYQHHQHHHQQQYQQQQPRPLGSAVPAHEAALPGEGPMPSK